MPRSSSCYVDGVLHRTRQIWASCDQDMLRTALFLSMEMGREANLLMKPLQVLHKRQSCAGGGNKSGRCSECSGAVVRLTRSVTSPSHWLGPVSQPDMAAVFDGVVQCTDVLLVEND